MPIVVDGHVVGGIGVSGASSADEDQELAVIGAEALAAGNGRANGARFFSSDDLARKFAEGGLLLEEQSFKLDAGRRDGPGAPEVHSSQVDVMRVVQGSATVVTGGEIRGDRIEGGEERTVSEGDVLAIPSGVPHQFVEVSDPFLYFVVKVEE